MTDKLVLAELPAGGAKTVIMAHNELDTDAAYRVVGDAIEALGGSYVCGPDLGTGAHELTVLRSRTAHVNPPGNDAGKATAAGVLAAIRGLCAHRFGSRSLTHRTFAIQGLGSVGLALAEALIAEGGVVFGHDVDADAVSAARRLGVEISSDGSALWQRRCEVFVPCALGGVLTETTAATIAAECICGSANNQLQNARVANQLHARGVVWVPDVLSSVGAVVEGVVTVRNGGRSAAALSEIARRIDAIESRVGTILAQAATRRISPQAVVHERLVTLGCREASVRSSD